ncbi:hypothetical protein [Paenibacillus sp. PL91]|uniref:hypothetical protein n=1 Tax=Paenibacillus sp. PL91 TaxID=2729538 RepID=UPI00145F7203|nr:hypothetical protein [Paenibacillus sp. PL91]MBC9199445.1 hypothetical protein [Paenibacillus sp. PL91]
MKTRNGYILLAAMALLLIIFVFNWLRTNTDHFNMFMPFAVTLNNDSDYDIVSVKMGIVSSTSAHTYTKPIKAGDSVRIKPQLQLTGEGAVYLEYTDARGVTRENIACGYTESLTGRAELTIDNDRFVLNEQDCW